MERAVAPDGAGRAIPRAVAPKAGRQNARYAGVATPEAALAAPGRLLSAELESRLPALAGIIGRKLESGFLRSAGPLDARQKKALLAVTVGAAARMVAAGGTLADFMEQVEYNGRRLAKLDQPPRVVLGALQEYMRMLELLVADEALRAASAQLNLAIVAALNNAFYDVREDETRAFFQLSQAELGARTEPELLAGVLSVLKQYCRADEARLYVFDGQGSVRLAAAVEDAEPGAGGANGAAPPAPAVRFAADVARLSRPVYVPPAGPQRRLVPDAKWRRRFASFWSVPLLDGDGRKGVMQFAFSREYEWLPRERRLLEGAAAHAALAWGKQALAAALAERERQLQELAGHLAEAEESERRRIGRELHDETGQVLLCLRLKLDMLGAAAPEALRGGLAEARDLIDRMVVDVRRLIADLSPSALESAGFAVALRQLAKRFERACGIRAHLRVGRLPALGTRMELLLYRLAQECLNNAAKHSGASAVNLSIRSADGEVRFLIEDNGAGFSARADRTNSFGLAGMRERVALAGGRLAIESRPGEGTRIEAIIPAPQAPAGKDG